MEQYYIEKYDTFNNGFNLTTGGDECKMHSLSDEAKRKIGEKNRVNMLGKKHSEETKKKMSETHKKMMQSEEERKKRSEKLVGIKRSEEHKEKLRLANQGTKSSFAKYTEEFIEKLRIEYMNGIKQKDLASKYNIKPTTLKHILANRTWKHVSPEGWQEFLINKKNSKIS